MRTHPLGFDYIPKGESSEVEPPDDFHPFHCISVMGREVTLSLQLCHPDERGWARLHHDDDDPFEEDEEGYVVERQRYPIDEAPSGMTAYRATEEFYQETIALARELWSMFEGPVKELLDRATVRANLRIEDVLRERSQALAEADTSCEASAEGGLEDEPDRGLDEPAAPSGPAEGVATAQASCDEEGSRVGVSGNQGMPNGATPSAAMEKYQPDPSGGPLSVFLLEALHRRWPSLEPLWMELLGDAFAETYGAGAREGLVCDVFAPLVAELWTACAQEVLRSGREYLEEAESAGALSLEPEEAAEAMLRRA
jgi:hypothetical protein